MTCFDQTTGPRGNFLCGGLFITPVFSCSRADVVVVAQDRFVADANGKRTSDQVFREGLTAGYPE
jgi:hypothetical protein